jgi:PAS domain S-box-containing protein
MVFQHASRDATEALLRRIAEDVPLPTAVLLAPDWRVVYANRTCRSLPAVPADILGRPIGDIFDTDALTTAAAQVRDSGQPVSCQGVCLGTPPRWWDFDLHPLPDADGGITTVLVIARDVTAETVARREAEAATAALARQAEQMRLAIGAARMFFWDWDMTTDRVEWSDGLEDAMGMPPGAFGGTIAAFRALVYPDDLPRVEAALRRAIAGEAPYEIEFRMTRADGSVRWTLTRGTVQRDAAGVPVRMVGVDLDLTARRAVPTGIDPSSDGGSLRRFIETSPAGMALFDRDMRYLAVSQRYCDDTGLDPATVIGQSHYAVLPDQPERWRAVHQRCLAGATESHDDDLFVRANGQQQWCRWLIRPWHDARGNIGGLYLFQEDVTARKLAEMALQRQERSYRLALAGPPVVVFEQDRDLRYTWIDNPQLGYQADAVIGLTDVDLFEDPDDAAAIVALKRGVLDSGVRARTEVRVRDKGVDHYYDLTVEPVRDETGAVTAVTCAAIETTEIRGMAAALARSEARLRAVLQQIPAAVAIMEPPDGTVVLRNLYAERLFGPPLPGGDPAQPRLVAFHRDGRPYLKHENPGRRALYQGETVVAEPVLHCRIDGTMVELEISAAPVRDPDGSIVAAAIVTNDLTERNQAARALARSHADLERRVADRTRALSEAAHELALEMRRREQVQATLLQVQKLEALGQMTSGIAHDFRNLLAAIGGSFELLRKRLADPRAVSLIELGEQAVSRADRLTGQMLAFARRQTPAPERVQPADLLAGLLDFIRHSVGGRIWCEVAVAPDTWPILVDTGQLEVALLNLAVNARDAMPDGGSVRIEAANLPAGHPDIHRFGLVPADHVVIEVRDTGTGMAEEVVRRATEPFFTTKEVGKGTGLGLAMVDDFARRSGGRLRIDSRPGAGTIIAILLPRAEEAELVRHGGAVIALADPDEAARGRRAGHLRALGYSVMEAGAAEAALTLAASVEPLDLVIVAAGLADADGVPLADRLRGDHPQLPQVELPAGEAPPRDTDVLIRRVARALGRLPDATPPA